MPHKWGIIGFGEAGSAFAAHLSRQDGTQLVITDPVLTQMPAPALRAKLHGTKAEVVDEIAQLVERSEICVSLVTPKSAGAVARAAASPWRGELFIDFNSVSPAEKRHMAGFFPDGAFVGGAILGSIAGEGATSRLALDGPRAADAERALNAAGFRSQAISTSPGAAAALKMCRSIFMKGVECLLVETMLAAADYQITGAVLDSIADTLRTYGFRPMAEMLVTTHAVHCSRRSDEMERVAEMLSGMCLPNVMSAASREFLARSAKTGITEHFRGELPAASDPVIKFLKQSY